MVVIAPIVKVPVICPKSPIAVPLVTTKLLVLGVKWNVWMGLVLPVKKIKLPGVLAKSNVYVAAFTLSANPIAAAANAKAHVILTLLESQSAFIFLWKECEVSVAILPLS
jgi:hypothetical protein